MTYRIELQEHAPNDWSAQAQQDGVYVRDLENSRWHVARVGRLLVGFGATAIPWADHTRLYSLWVRPSWRGKGVGSDLVRHRLGATNTATYTLYTSIPSFFERFGFSIDREYENSVRMQRTKID